MTSLWAMDTHWFKKPKDDHINSTYFYKGWKDFTECKPYKLWKPYILSSWSWKTRTIDEVKMEKKREIEGSVLDCTKILRVYPSSYDEVTYIDETKEKIEMLQIVFLSPHRFSGVHRVEMPISKENEEEVRQWLMNHMPTFWKL